MSNRIKSRRPVKPRSYYLAVALKWLAHCSVREQVARDELNEKQRELRAVRNDTREAVRQYRRLCRA